MELAEEILGEKIQLAVLHFQNRNFEKCISLYNEIISQLESYGPSYLVKARRHFELSEKPPTGALIHPKLVSVLDQRAASYEKLDKLDLARKDAERMIALDPISLKGYLRLGKLHLKRKDALRAYKVFQKGVYTIERAIQKLHVEVSGKLFKQLKSQYRELNVKLKEEQRKTTIGQPDSQREALTDAVRAQSFSSLQRRLDEMLPLKRSMSTSNAKPKKQKKTFDPISRFPHDIIELIFIFLPFRNLLRCHLVSKEWYYTLTSIPKLYKLNFHLKHRITAPEYFQGLRLMKKVLMFLYSKSVDYIQLWSTYNSTHLSRILENVFSDFTIKLSRLDLMNKDLSMEMLLRTLHKVKWDCASLSSVKHVRLGFNSTPIIEAGIFLMFPNLDTLETFNVANLMRGSNSHLLASFCSSPGYKSFTKEAENLTVMASLERFTAVNNPQLTREKQRVMPGERTFDPSPPFLDIRFPALRELKLVSYDFLNLEPMFGKFLSSCVHLKELYLENNEEMSIRKLLMILRLYEPSFKLDKLTIREKFLERAYSLNEFDGAGFSCLSELSHLDLYGNFISSRGLLKLLKIANTECNLQTLNLGSSSHIYFRNDKFITDRESLKFSEIFDIVPGLQNLYLPELDLDNLSLKLLNQEYCKTIGSNARQLKKLDLSFCHLVDGIGLMNLVNAPLSQQTLGASALTFAEVILDGLSFNKETLELLKRKKLIEEVRNDPLKTKWRQYGVNSYIIESVG